MRIGNRRNYFKNVATLFTAVAGIGTLFGQNTPAGPSATGTRKTASPNNRIHDGIYYFPGIGSNSGYPREDRISVTDPFEKHVVRAMDSLKRSLERAGSTMDSILHLEVYICLPHSDSLPTPSGTARFEAYSAHYQSLNKIYGTYFSAGSAPSRAFMAVDWIPGDSLVEVVGSARVVNPPSAAAQ
jgi:enamine deaminase RidA (YjgF/YER057c/UK114 family)